jgi:hypothetical protein
MLSESLKMPPFLPEDDEVAQRAREYCKTVNRQIFSFDLAIFAKKELDLEQQKIFDEAQGEVFFNDRD